MGDLFSYATFLCFLVFLVILSLHLLSLLFKDNSTKSSTTLPPGKSGWPWIGESLEFLSSGRHGYPENFMFDRIKRYSSNVFRTHLFMENFVVICGAPGNRFLFSNENKLVRAWWPKSVVKIVPPLSSKEESIAVRKMLVHFFKPESLQSYISIMDLLAQKHFSSEWENKNEVVVFPLTKRYTFRVACRLFLSVEDPTQIAKFEEHFNHIATGLLSIPINLPGTQFRQALNDSKFIRLELAKIIKQRKIDLGEGKATATQDLLSHMLLTSDEHGKFMKEIEIADSILGLLIAGHDTASSACTFVVKYLAELPEVYDGVYKEQMGIAKSKGPGEVLNWDDIQKMKYSWNVACETMRLAPPIPGTFREAINDFTFNGFSIPKGWKLYWSANATHKDPEYFPDPIKFDPSRFQGSGPAPYTFVPFGGGPRMCPGMEYARLEILVFMHHLVRRFKWEKIIPDENIVINPMPVPAKGLPVRLYPHKASNIE